MSTLGRSRMVKPTKIHSLSEVFHRFSKDGIVHELEKNLSQSHSRPAFFSQYSSRCKSSAMWSGQSPLLDESTYPFAKVYSFRVCIVHRRLP